MLNKAMIIGRLGKDPELRYTQSGMPVVSLAMATSENYVDKDGIKQEKTEWHTVVFFNRQAELCAQFLSKGSLIYVEGSLQTRSWEDTQGQKRYTTEIRGNRVQFLDKKGAAMGEMPVASPTDNFESFPADASSIDDVPF